MKFREWLLLNEKAERTSSKVPLYPSFYPYYLHAKIQPHVWKNFEDVFGDENIPKPDWPKMGEDAPAHSEGVPHPKVWKMPS